MESITRTSAFVRLARLLLTLLIVVVTLPACMQPTVYRFEVPVPFHLPAQLPPGAEKLPLKAGIYYSPEFEKYEHYDRTVGESGVATPVGEFSVRQFDSMLFEMFEDVQPVGHRPPYAANDPASELHVIIEPRIERFAANIETFSMGPLTARIDYRFKLYLPDGTTLATWNISASDTGKKGGWDSGVKFYEERTKALVQKSSNQFMQKFFDAPEVKTWLAEISEKNAGTAKLAKAPDSAFDVNASALTSGAAAVVASMTLEGVDVSAKLYWQVGPTRIPVGNSSVKSQILAAHLAVKNNRAEPIVIDPSNLRLRTNQFATLTPDSARSVAQKMFRDGTYGDDGTTAAFFAGGIFGVLASMDQANVNDQMIKTTTNELRHAELDNQTIDPNQTASGIAYFIALGVDGKLDKPELRVSIFDPSQRKSYETTLNMTAGTATGGTLLLAGLKPPESVPEKIKVVEAPQQAEEAADTTKGPLRVGLLPPLSAGSSKGDEIEGEIYKEIRRYIASDRSFDLSFDYTARYGAGSLDTHAVWQGTVVKMVPDEAKLRVIGEELGADILVLTDASGVGSYGARIEISMYVFDVASGKMYQSTDNFEQLKTLVESTFGPIERQQARQRAGSSAVVSVKADSLPTKRIERIALLPADGWGLASANSSAITEEEIHRYAREVLIESGQVIVDRSHQDSYYRGTVWAGNNWNKELNLAYAVAEGKKLGVDGVLTFKYLVRGIGGAYIIEIDAALVDVATSRVYRKSSSSSDSSEARINTESVLRSFMKSKRHQNRRGEGSTTATGGALLLAGSKPPESTIGTTEKAAATATVHTQSRRQLLNPPELRVLLTRNTYTGQTKTGTKFHVYYRADGTMYGRLLSGRSKGKQDDGTWNVTNERGYCSRWAQWDGAAELCFNVFRYGESVIFEQNSGYESRKSAGVMQSGNPENL